ncbi:MAG: TatD family hydrolase [Desulfobacterales bacterium]|nr:TatD family hydrolase [Desulfobacterales bacterium]MDX2513108.1 TatD family hydrolase [Desulfobacterales bacterium]
MKLFDSHCHLDDRSDKKDLEAVIHRAKQDGISNMMTVGIDRETSIRAIEIAGKFDGVYASIGIHPHRASSCSDQVMERLIDLAENPRVRAWGETGLDFNRMYSPKNDQEKWFIRQVQTADERRLPLILHERDSHGRLLEILKAHPNKNRRGVVHCFSGNRPELDAYLDLGFFIGVTGILTLQKRGTELRNLIRHVPLERLLIETDAPYLTPTPQKNKTRRNEPAFVKSVLLKLAEIRDIDPEELAELTLNNTRCLFKIKDTPVGYGLGFS